MSTIQVRIEEKEKKEVKKILSELGLDISSAVKIYFKQIKKHKGIPFELLTENGLTFKDENKLLEIAKNAKKGKNISRKLKGKEVIDYLHS